MYRSCLSFVRLYVSQVYVRPPLKLFPSKNLRNNVSKTIRPRRRIEIVKRLEIRGVYEESPAGANVPKPALTCPLGNSLLFIQSVTIDTSV